MRSSLIFLLVIALATDTLQDSIKNLVIPSTKATEQPSNSTKSTRMSCSWKDASIIGTLGLLAIGAAFLYKYKRNSQTEFELTTEIPFKNITVHTLSFSPWNLLILFAVIVCVFALYLIYQRMQEPKTSYLQEDEEHDKSRLTKTATTTKKSASSAKASLATSTGASSNRRVKSRGGRSIRSGRTMSSSFVSRSSGSISRSVFLDQPSSRVSGSSLENLSVSYDSEMDKSRNSRTRKSSIYKDAQKKLKRQKSSSTQRSTEKSKSTQLSTSSKSGLGTAFASAKEGPRSGKSVRLESDLTSSLVSRDSSQSQ